MDESRVESDGGSRFTFQITVELLDAARWARHVERDLGGEQVGVLDDRALQPQFLGERDHLVL